MIAPELIKRADCYINPDRSQYPYMWMWWEKNGELYMYINVPSPILKGGHFVALRMMNNGNWAFKGDRLGWDLNIEKPTLHPSILVHDHWHGWVCNGLLVDANDSLAKVAM